MELLRQKIRQIKLVLVPNRSLRYILRKLINLCHVRYFILYCFTTSSDIFHYFSWSYLVFTLMFHRWDADRVQMSNNEEKLSCINYMISYQTWLDFQNYKNYGHELVKLKIWHHTIDYLYMLQQKQKLLLKHR